MCPFYGNVLLCYFRKLETFLETLLTYYVLQLKQLTFVQLFGWLVKMTGTKNISFFNFSSLTSLQEDESKTLSAFNPQNCSAKFSATQIQASDLENNHFLRLTGNG